MPWVWFRAPLASPGYLVVKRGKRILLLPLNGRCRCYLAILAKRNFSGEPRHLWVPVYCTVEARHTAVLPNARTKNVPRCCDGLRWCKCLSGVEASSKLSAHLTPVLGSEDCRVVKLLGNYLLPTPVSTTTDAVECLLKPAAENKTFLSARPSIS